jgi:tetratricopeptide (TPR) repeat protein
LSGQTAISSSSAPLNVEFSTKSAMKKPVRDNKSSPPETKTIPSETSDASRHQPPGASKSSEGGAQDPKAISESLRRIRTSGPLIIEAIKQKNDQQKNERINEIITQSVQGFNENDVKSEERPTSPRPAPPPPPPPPPVQKSKKANRQANQKAKAQPAHQGRDGVANAKSARARQNNQASATPPAQSIAQTAAQTVAAAVAAARKTTGFLSNPLSNPSSGPAANRSQTSMASNTGQLPPNGPSTVLVQASGFKPQSGLGPKVLVGLISLAVLLAAGTYFTFRDKLLTQAYVIGGDRNLVSPEDQSAQLVELGERERNQGKQEAAIGYFQRALELAPNSPNIRFLLAQTSLSAGQTDDAMRGYQELLRIAPEHLEARLQLAEIYRARGNWNAAYKEYRNIIELDHSSPQAAFALEAIEKRQAEEQPEAQGVEVFSPRRNRNRAPQKSAPTLPGALPGALPSAAVRPQVPLLSQRGTTPSGINPPAALNSARPEERPDPRAMSDMHKKLGVRYLNVREFRAAINEFLQALSLTPNDKDLYYFIGSSHHGLGQYAEAYNYYRRVDSGPYVGPAQSGAKQTEKAAHEEYKRGQAQRFQSMKDEPGNGGANNPNRPTMNRVVDSFRK